VILGLTGCSSKGEALSQAPKEIQNEFANAPKWVLTQENEKGINAAGSAKIGNAGTQFAITEAEANARDQMARQMQIKVGNMIKNFTQQIGVGDTQSVDKVMESVSKQVSKQELIGTQRKDIWISPSGELWVLMSMSEQSMNAVKNAIKSSFQNDEALHQQVLAKQAQDELDKELEKL
jgi:ribosomal protein S20